MGLEHELEVATTLANQAGSMVRRACREVWRGGGSLRPGDTIALADLITEAIILPGLQREFPEDAVCAEQFGQCSSRKNSARLWLVDALDGLASLMDGKNEHAISIGLAVGGCAVVGVVHNPIREELFAGAESCSIVVNGVPVQTIAQSDLPEARFGLPRNEWERLVPAGLNALTTYPTEGVAYRLARVAAGMDDGFLSFRPLREWTTCAGVALVQASGMPATLQDSIAITYNSRTLRHSCGIVAAPKPLHSVLINLLMTLPEFHMRGLRPPWPSAA